MCGLSAWAMLALASCSANCTPSVWELSFESDALETSARAVRIDVRAGTCAAPGALRYSRSLVRGGMQVQPPALGPGAFALEAIALDGSCRRIAVACTDLAAGSCPAAIRQTLSSTPIGPVECASCDDGSCAGSEDAGSEDAGSEDAGSEDASAADARRCGHAAAETLCGDGVDDDCDGNTDCADQECDVLPSTCAGSSGICRGDACCAGCWDGVRCSGGRAPHACGNGGAACIDCGACRCGTEGTCEC